VYKYTQDLRKRHLNRRIFELLNQVI
jgi:hypothetical protein